MAAQPRLAALQGSQPVGMTPEQAPRISNMHPLDIEEDAAADHSLAAGPLTKFDVFSLIVNKMVGTGIFTAPSLVLALTGSPSVAVGLWAVGLAYTILRYAEKLFINLTLGTDHRL